MRRRIRILLTASALGVAGCSLLASLDGLTTDGGRDPAPDAGYDATAKDASTGDAPANDAGSEAAMDAACRGSWCDCVARASTFCDDFDNPGEEAGSGWSQVLIGPEASVTLTTEDRVSPPRAMLSTTPAAFVTPHPAVVTQESFGALAPGGVLRVAFDAKADFSSGQCRNTEQIPLVIGLRELSASTENVFLWMNPNGELDLQIDNNAASPPQSGAVRLPTNPIRQKWSRLAVEVRVVPSDAGRALVAKLFLRAPGTDDDAGTLAAELSVDHRDAARVIDVTVGLKQFSGSSACRLFVDNVTMTLE